MAHDKQASLKLGNSHKPVRTAPVERINQVLRGEVIDIYINHVPAFKGLERGKVYEMVMSNPALAAECYALFTNRPELFQRLMVDKDGRPVSDEKARLSCGRTLAEVTAMIVRAVAKRHFLKRFKPVPATPPPQPKQPLSDRLVYLFKKPPQAPKQRRKATRGDSLYRAMRHHLLYHWQLPLIPHYTPLPVSVVRQLGAKILEYRTAASLKVLLEQGAPPEDEAAALAANSNAAPAATSPLGEPQPASSSMIRVKMPGTERTETVGQAKMEAMWTVAKALSLSEVFGVDESELRRMIMNASVTTGSVITSLSAHGLKMRNLVVVLCAFERKFGKARMPLMFGPQARPAFIDALGSMIKVHGIGELQHPDDIKNRVEVLIRQMQRASQLPT